MSGKQVKAPQGVGLGGAPPPVNQLSSFAADQPMAPAAANG